MDRVTLGRGRNVGGLERSILKKDRSLLMSDGAITVRDMNGGKIKDVRGPAAAQHPSRLLVLNVAVKLLLAGLLIFSLAAPDLPQFSEKAMSARALTYPWSALLVPAVWWLRGRPSSYPHLVDTLIVLPFLVDVGGNAANLYNTTRYFDDIAHFCNWALLTTAFGAVVASLPIGRLNAAALTLGFGTATQVLWEISEYIVMHLGSSGLQLTYEDTIGDLVLGFSGTLVGVLLTATLLWGHSFVSPVLLGPRRRSHGRSRASPDRTGQHP